MENHPPHVKDREGADVSRSTDTADLDRPRRDRDTADLQPFGRPGRPFGSHPFVFGFTAALGVLTAWILLQALNSVASALIIIVVSLFLAIGLNPGVEILERRGLSRTWSVTVVFIAVIVFFVLFGLAIVPPLTTQMGDFFAKLPDYLQQLQNNPTVRGLDERFQLIERLQQYISSGNMGSQVFGGLLGVATTVINAVFTALTVLILTLYFLASLPSTMKWTYRMVPRSRRDRVQLLGDEVIKRIGGYVAGNLIVSLIAGVVTYIFLVIAGVPYALALALLVAITDLIPLVGAAIGATIVTLVGLFTSLPVGIACLIFFIVYQQVENFWIAPRVMQANVQVPAVVTVAAALIGGALLGLVGALLAIPVAAAILLLMQEVVLPRQERH